MPTTIRFPAIYASSDCKSYYMVTGVLHALCNGRHLRELKARRLVCKDAMKSTPENLARIRQINRPV
jgi:hypothetical protein